MAIMQEQQNSVKQLVIHIVLCRTITEDAGGGDCSLFCFVGFDKSSGNDDSHCCIFEGPTKRCQYFLIVMCSTFCFGAVLDVRQ